MDGRGGRGPAFRCGELGDRWVEVEARVGRIARVRTLLLPGNLGMVGEDHSSGSYQQVPWLSRWPLPTTGEVTEHNGTLSLTPNPA